MSAFSPILTQGMARLRHLPACRRAATFLRWWRAELEALLPARVREWRARRQWRLDVRLAQGRVALTLRSGDGEEVSDDVVLDPEGEGVAALERRLADRRALIRRWLLLPPDKVLRPRLDLPKEAAPRLAQVLVHELDRLTPFSASQVVFDHRLGPSAGERLEVELVVLPRHELDAALAPLSRLGLDGVDVCDQSGQPLGVNLLPPDRRLPRRNPWRRLDLALAASLAMVFVALLWNVLDRHRAAATTLRQDIAAQRAGAEAAVRLRDELTGSLEAANFLGRRTAEQPALTELLADLTRRLPDDTWLEHLGLEGGRLTLEGQTSDAAALVAALQSSPQLREATLGSVVRVDTRGDRDRFTLTATVEAVTEPASPGGSDADVTAH
jgi:general secretion pathway protein L